MVLILSLVIISFLPATISQLNHHQVTQDCNCAEVDLEEIGKLPHSSSLVEQQNDEHFSPKEWKKLKELSDKLPSGNSKDCFNRALRIISYVLLKHYKEEKEKRHSNTNTNYTENTNGNISNNQDAQSSFRHLSNDSALSFHNRNADSVQTNDTGNQNYEIITIMDSKTSQTTQSNNGITMNASSKPHSTNAKNSTNRQSDLVSSNISNVSDEIDLDEPSTIKDDKDTFNSAEQVPLPYPSDLSSHSQSNTNKDEQQDDSQPQEDLAVQASEIITIHGLQNSSSKVGNSLSVDENKQNHPVYQQIPRTFVEIGRNTIPPINESTNPNTTPSKQEHLISNNKSLHLNPPINNSSRTDNVSDNSESDTDSTQSTSTTKDDELKTGIQELSTENSNNNNEKSKDIVKNISELNHTSLSNLNQPTDNSPTVDSFKNAENGTEQIASHDSDKPISRENLLKSESQNNDSSTSDNETEQSTENDDNNHSEKTDHTNITSVNNTNKKGNNTNNDSDMPRFEENPFQNKNVDTSSVNEGTLKHNPTNTELQNNNSSTSDNATKHSTDNGDYYHNKETDQTDIPSVNNPNKKGNDTNNDSKKPGHGENPFQDNIASSSLVNEPLNHNESQSGLQNNNSSTSDNGTVHSTDNGDFYHNKETDQTDIPSVNNPNKKGNDTNNDSKKPGHGENPFQDNIASSSLVNEPLNLNESQSGLQNNNSSTSDNRIDHGDGYHSENTDTKTPNLNNTDDDVFSSIPANFVKDKSENNKGPGTESSGLLLENDKLSTSTLYSEDLNVTTESGPDYPFQNNNSIGLDNEMDHDGTNHSKVIGNTNIPNINNTNIYGNITNNDSDYSKPDGNPFLDKNATVPSLDEEELLKNNGTQSELLNNLTTPENGIDQGTDSDAYYHSEETDNTISTVNNTNRKSDITNNDSVKPIAGENTNHNTTLPPINNLSLTNSTNELVNYGDISTSVMHTSSVKDESENKKGTTTESRDLVVEDDKSTSTSYSEDLNVTTESLVKKYQENTDTNNQIHSNPFDPDLTTHPITITNPQTLNEYYTTAKTSKNYNLEPEVVMLPKSSEDTTNPNEMYQTISPLQNVNYLDTTTLKDVTESDFSDEGFIKYFSLVSRHHSQNRPLPSPVPQNLKRSNCLKVPEYIYSAK